MPPQPVIVTGGAGFIGSHVVDALVAQGFAVVVVDDLSSGSRENLNPAAEFHHLDIRSLLVHELILRVQPRALFHLAAQVSVRNSVADPGHDADVNILGSLNLLEAAVKARVPKVIFSSTGGAIYGEQDYFPADEAHPRRPLCPYGVAKLAVENYLFYYRQEYGLEYAALRYANVYGPRQDPHGEAGVVAIFSQKLLWGDQAVINGDGGQTRDFVFVGDVARANLLALHDAVRGPVNIGTGLETSVNDLFSRLSTLIGSSRPEFHGPAKPGEQRRSVITYDHAHILMGWAPQVSLDDGLQATVAYFRKKASQTGP